MSLDVRLLKSHPMKYHIILAIVCLGTLQMYAQDKFDYSAAVALAIERTQEKAPREQCIFVLGPEQNEELYSSNGKELKRTLPYCRTFRTDNFKTIEKLLSNNIPLGTDISYQIAVYRSDSNDPVLRIRGSSDSLRLSQFPLKGGDVLVITRADLKK